MTESSTEVIEYENRTGVKWTIKEDDLKHAFKLGVDFKSDTFKASNIPGAKYFLALESPRTRDDSTDENVLIFLKSCFGTNRKVAASYKISIKSASFNDEMNYGGFEFGCGNVICGYKEKLFDPENKFFVGGIMEIDLEITVKTHGIKRKAAKPLSLGELLWEKEEDKDITFVADGQELKAHKWIISSCSSVFKAALESGMKEAIEKKITITDFSYETVKIAIEHCYEREVDDLLNDKNASELLHFADKYNIQPLHKLLQIYFIDKLSESNVVNFANLSIKTNAEELRDVCVSFLMKYIGKNTKIEDVKNLDKEISSDVGQRCLLYFMSEYEYFCYAFF
uniref:BTB domain-containing protein n=1 Tax=Panagrolaimus sp. PS1159 TaxID=55785 RepID=A0AC35FDN9_9BILA